MSSKSTGLKAPSKIQKPTGLQQPKTGIPSGTSSKAQSAFEKSARAAGLNANFATKYASEALKKVPAPEPEHETPADDFKIGDRVWVAGTKPGIIAFLGETQFAPGEWAGVVLDEKVGKNDGSVGGVRYFQCEAKRGVFSRITKLTRTQQAPGAVAAATAETTTARRPSAVSPTGSSTGIPHENKMSTSLHMTSNGAVLQTPKPKTGLAKKTVGGSHSNLLKTPSTSASNLGHGDVRKNPDIKIGDKVLVSGSKAGVLRFLGETDFAKGEWAGVELNEPQGKNDGSVAGKRYFECKPLYGLFAPSHKVTKGLPGTTPARRTSITKTGLNRDRSGSQDSVSSIGSSASTASRSRITPKAATTTRTSHTATTTALQKALKEKVEHIDQLLRERDLERSEVARVASQVDEAENQHANLQKEYRTYMEEAEETIGDLKDKVHALEQQKREVSAQLDEQKRNLEDLQFTIEETAIDKGEIEEISEESQQKLAELEKDLANEKEKNKQLVQQIESTKTQGSDDQGVIKDLQSKCSKLEGELEEMRHKYNMTESKMRSLEEDKNVQGQKASQNSELLGAKDDKIVNLETSLQEKDSKLKEITDKLAELTEQLEDSNSKQKKQQDTIDELMKKLASSDSNSSTLITESNSLKSRIAELSSQFESSNDRCNQLDEDKQKLEHQISELMRHSGDSSQQLSLMNDQLVEKDRKLQELQAALSDSTQNLGKLKHELEAQQREGEREIEVLVSKHQEDLKSFTDRLEEQKSETEKLSNKLTKTVERHEQDMSELRTKKDEEISNIRSTLESKEQEITENVNQSTEMKAQVEALQTEKQELEFEKEKSQKAITKAESETESVKAELNEVKQERDLIKSERVEFEKKQNSAGDEVKRLNEENEKSKGEIEKLLSAQKELENKQKKVEEERDNLLREKSTTLSGLQEKDLKLEEKESKIQELMQEVEKYMKEAETSKDSLTRHIEQAELKASQDSQVVDDMQQEISSLQSKCTDTDRRMKLVETEREALKMQVTKLKTVQQEKQQLEQAQQSMMSQITELKDSVDWETKMLEDFELEKRSLQNTLESTNLLLQQKSKQLENNQTELAAVQGENTLMKSYKNQVHSYQQELDTMKEKVQQLEFELVEAQTNATAMSNIDMSEDTILGKLQSDNQSKQNEIDFLNSVIVEQQASVSELQQRLKAMEDGTYLNGGASTEINENTIKKPPPRLFCDICEEFDKHDTEDCPLQAMSDSEGPPPTQHHGTRGQQRSYCDTCEVFGHWTEDCDEEETF